MTNLSGTEQFGQSNLAAGTNSGTFEGSTNTVCDALSVIVGGSDSTIDGGSAFPNSAEGSFIGAGGGNAVYNAYSFIGAGLNNSVNAVANNGSNGSFIGAGDDNSISGDQSFLGAGFKNIINGSRAFIGAGLSSAASGDGSFVGAGNAAFFVAQGGGISGTATFASGTDAFVGAGDLNEASGNGSFVGGGDYTYATSASKPTAIGNLASGADSFIGAGDQNTVAASESFVGSGTSNDITSSSGYGAIAGGLQNVMSGQEAFIGSGTANSIASGGTYASILGGKRNAVSAQYASILGGFGNTASGQYAIVAGGNSDTAAGTVSFAAGYHADAAHNGSFVWSDYSSGSTTVEDSAVNRFIVRASGGTYVYSNEAATAGVKLAAGSGAWSNLSDRNAKTDVRPLDDASILAKVTTLPVSTWSYKSERGVRHAGPMAQDFYSAFGVGEDDRHITSIDEDGVALAAIKALAEQNARQNMELRARNADLERRLRAIEARLHI